MKIDSKNQGQNGKEYIIKKFDNGEATVGIIGLGYVGLPLALTYASKKIKVLGFDINENIINKIRDGESYIHHIKSEIISKARINNMLEPTSDISRVQEVDAIIICVPTPLKLHREPDLKYIKQTIKSISDYLRPYQVLSLESTTYPGTTEEIIQPYIDKKGFKIGEDFFLIYSPEREDPGNTSYNTSNIPKVLGGYTQNCSEVGFKLYSQIISKIVTLSSLRAAEMTKLLENIHRAVNIGLMNELKPLANKMNIDLYEVIRAASTKPFGFVPYYPGPGLGGHCIPIDPFYLTWKAREYGMDTRFIELAGQINASMPEYVVQKVSEALNNKKKSINGSNLIVLGLAYKKNVDDARESPSIELIKLLTNKGANVKFIDPYFEQFPDIRKYKLSIEKIDLNQENLVKSDCLIVATDHDCFDYELIKNFSELIIDTRGKYNTNDKIIRA